MRLFVLGGHSLAAALALALPAGGAAAGAVPLVDTLYVFGQPGHPGDGDTPSQYQTPAFDLAGNLYGTTALGGANNEGTVYRFDPSTQTETVLYSFGSGEGGGNPYGNLLLDKSGNIFGTANTIVYELIDNGGGYTEKTLYSDQSVSFDSGVTMDKKGNLYGTSSGGGANGLGFVYKLNAKGQFTILHSFNGSDGANPIAGVVMDKKQNLYGTASAGGGPDNCGAAYKLTPGGAYTVLGYFDAALACGPIGGVVLDKEGDVYGTTVAGGTGKHDKPGYGTVYELTTAGQIRLLHVFGISPNDGGEPESTLLMDKKGNLYGATEGGGPVDDGGWGTAFRITGNREKELGAFDVNNNESGGQPEGGVAVGPDGALYGVTIDGGSSTCASNCGTIYKISK